MRQSGLSDMMSVRQRFVKCLVFAVESVFFMLFLGCFIPDEKLCVFASLKKVGFRRQMFFLQILKTLLNAASEGVDKTTEFPLQPRYHGADHETLSVPFGMENREGFCWEKISG